MRDATLYRRYTSRMLTHKGYPPMQDQRVHADTNTLRPKRARVNMFAPMEDMTMLTGKQCAAARVFAGLTQRELARQAGVYLRTLVDFENERRAPKPDTKRAIASVLTQRTVLLSNGGVAPKAT